MAELKTKSTTTDPKEFLNAVESEEKRADSFRLLNIFEETTGEKPVMWGDSIVGFGRYHYKSERSSQQGDWFRVGFSPRKQNLTLYVMIGNQDNPILKKLGKFKISGGSCLYINKLADIDTALLPELIKSADEYMKKAYPTSK